jgi:hypothetical protein
MADVTVFVTTGFPNDVILRLNLEAQGRVFIIAAPMTQAQAQETAETLVALIQLLGHTAVIIERNV